MITYKPIVIPGGRRKDGTWPVKIRVTFKGVSRRLPTTLACQDSDLTRSGKIKNATILEKAGELISRMRGACDGLSPFTLEAWDVDAVVDHIKNTLAGESFRLDFFEFADGFLEGRIAHTKNYYITALNALERFLGKRELDVNWITRRMLLDFAEWVGNEAKAARHLAKLSHIYNEARNRYNDEDTGRIVIPRMPFQGMPKIQHLGKGQKPLELDVLQRLIEAEPENEWEAVAVAAFLVSFGTMGANLADLWDAEPQERVWSYRRHKTGTPGKVRIEPEIAGFIKVLQTERSSGWWLPELHRWASPDSATHNINKWLARWAEREGVERFTFYAARKSWATLARRAGVEWATIDEGLAHKGDFKMAKIYAEQNWELVWEANRKVLGLLSWDVKREDRNTHQGQK